MKNLFNITLSTMVALFFMTSCSKDEEVKVSPTKEFKISNEEMANEKNPYDKSGAIHNEYLDFFIKNVKTSEEVGLEKTLLITEQFHKENKMEYGDVEREKYFTLFETYAEAQKTGGPVIEWICKTYPKICEFINPSPFNPFTLLNASNGGTSTDRTLKFIEEIKAKEAKILSERNLEGENLERVLNYFAVARYSAGYWHNVAYVQKERSPWYETISEPNQAKPCHTCDIVKADADGATVAGPVGAGIASAAVALEKWWRGW